MEIKAKKMHIKTIFALGLVLASQAQAHVHFVEPVSISQGQTFKASFAIPHGCDGSATTSITVHMPEGVIAVKPQPKAGWRISKTQTRYAQPYTLYGKDVTSGVASLVFTGRLADDEYDEFTFSAHLAKVAQGVDKVAFKLEQRCESGQLLWTDVSGVKTSGHAAKELSAPFIPVAMPTDGHAHQH